MQVILLQATKTCFFYRTAENWTLKEQFIPIDDTKWSRLCEIKMLFLQPQCFLQRISKLPASDLLAEKSLLPCLSRRRLKNSRIWDLESWMRSQDPISDSRPLDVKSVSGPLSKINLSFLDHRDNKMEWFNWMTSEGWEAAGSRRGRRVSSTSEWRGSRQLDDTQPTKTLQTLEVAKKAFKPINGSHSDSWGLGMQGLKVISRLTCMRDSCSGTCQKPPPSHHCSEV